jgi:hypothetical protein
MSVRRDISRRDFLKAGSAGAALLGVSLAVGCSDEEGAPTGSPDSKAKAGAAVSGSSEPDNSIAERFTKLTRETGWRRTEAVPVKFRTYHPQGMTRVGDSFFVSSVETIVEPEEYEQPRDGYDRSTGEGVGHLFEFGMDGELLNRTELG